MPQATSYSTNETQIDSGTDASRLTFVINSLLAWVRTALPVTVVAVTNSGGASKVGYVNIQPLVGQTDGQGNVTPHGIIYNVPYLRIQGGTNAVILDPEVGDIGMAVFADRDISVVKSTQSSNPNGQSSPAGSKRRHHLSDAVYLHTIISQAAPTNYVAFTEGGIQVISPSQITIQAPNIVSNGAWQHTGSITVSDDVIASGVSLVNHLHGGIQPGGSDTSAPIPG